MYSHGVEERDALVEQEKIAVAEARRMERVVTGGLFTFLGALIVFALWHPMVMIDAVCALLVFIIVTVCLSTYRDRRLARIRYRIRELDMIQALPESRLDR